MNDAPESNPETTPSDPIADHLPHPGESLAGFQERMATLSAQPKSEWVEPTREQMKAAIKDETTPAPVRDFLRKKLHGDGSGGRKAAQQDRLKAIKITPGPHTASPYRRPEGVSSRQRKRGRRLMRMAAKALKASQ